jgi:hypothetical protein
MATTFKNFLSNDVASTRTLLHEAIPITGSIVSGTYTNADTVLGSEENIKTYGHGMFQSVYDYPYLSSSANHIFDITMGWASGSTLSSSAHSQNSKKINIYNQMAQYLVGYDVTGGIKRFTMPTTGDEMPECYFVPFSRLLTKDEIKKGSFSIDISISGSGDSEVANNLIEQGKTVSVMTERIQLTDFSGSSGYYVDSPVGEYGVLYATQSTETNVGGGDNHLLGANKRYAVGLLYYQAGVAVISASIFNGVLSGGILNTTAYGPTNVIKDRTPRIANVGDISTSGFTLAATGATIAQMGDGLRNRIYNISYNNTTELNSTIYFCRAAHNDFNYSSNPTYLTGSEIRVKTRASDTPVAYFTTVGLYSADNELLAVAKLSEPLRKDPTNEITLRVRLDY